MLESCASCDNIIPSKEIDTPTGKCLLCLSSYRETNDNFEDGLSPAKRPKLTRPSGLPHQVAAARARDKKTGYDFPYTDDVDEFDYDHELLDVDSVSSEEDEMEKPPPQPMNPLERSAPLGRQKNDEDYASDGSQAHDNDYRTNDDSVTHLDELAAGQPLGVDFPPQRKKQGRKCLETRSDHFFDTVGELRWTKYVRNGVQFHWKGDPIKYSKEMGRLYYRGFSFDGKDFSIGDPVWLNASEPNQGMVLIIGAFQATKSFVGKAWSKKGKGFNEEMEIQRRGYPYVLYYGLTWDNRKRRHLKIRKDHDENIEDPQKGYIDIPLCLCEDAEEPEKSIARIDDVSTYPKKVVEQIRIEGKKEPRDFVWMPENEALQVHCSNKRIEKVFYRCNKDEEVLSNRGSAPGRIPFRLVDDSDDDSDDFDEFSKKRILEDSNIEIESDDDSCVEDQAQEDDGFADYECNEDDVDDQAQGDDGTVDNDVNCDTSACSDNESDALGKFNRENLFGRKATHRITLNIEWQLPQKSDDEVDWFQKIMMERLLEWKSGFKANSARPFDEAVEVFRHHGQEVEEDIEKQLNDLVASLQITELKPLQKQVCAEVLRNPTRDVILTAPCGYGKSMCFMVAAKHFGGITLVVQPLHALIESMLEALLQNGITAEKLHSRKEVEGDITKLRANLRLEQLRRGESGQPRVLLSTAERMKCDMQSLERRGGKLKRIVIDEFDMCVEENRDTSRPTYAEIIPQLREVFPETPVMFFSATASRSVVKLVASRVNHHRGKHEKPILFIHHDPLPGKHFYGVEQKKHIDGCVERMIEYMDEYRKEANKKPQAIYYSIQPSDCTKAKEFFEGHGISAEIFVGTGDDTSKQKQNSHILDRFMKGEFQVLCANSALGRGVDRLPKNIRFCFHLAVPKSLDEYLQQTGRAGRDGERTICVLFYRDEDCSVWKDKLFPKNDRESLADLKLVCQYAWNGKICRRSTLAKCTLMQDTNSASCESTGRILCDNCLRRAQDCRKGVFDITSVARNFFENAKKYFTSGPCDRDFVKIPKEEVKDWKECALKMNHFSSHWIHYLTKGSCKFSQLNDLVRLVMKGFPSQRRSEIVVEVLKLLQQPKSITIVHHLSPILCLRTNLACTNDNMLNEGDSEDKMLNEKDSENEEVHPSKANHGLYFSAVLVDNIGKTGLDLQLLPPEKAWNKRLYRMFGSDRFLTINVKKSIDRTKVINFICKGLIVKKYKKAYRYLWAKKDKDPQQFIFFAEKEYARSKVTKGGQYRALLNF